MLYHIILNVILLLEVTSCTLCRRTKIDNFRSKVRRLILKKVSESDTAEVVMGAQCGFLLSGAPSVQRWIPALKSPPKWCLPMERCNYVVDAGCTVLWLGIQNYSKNCKLLQNSRYCNVCNCMHLFSLGFQDSFQKCWVLGVLWTFFKTTVYGTTIYTYSLTKEDASNA